MNPDTTVYIQEETKYKFWLHWLKKAGINILGIWKEDVVLCPKSWRAYYDEGYNVLEAIKEDLKHA